MVAKGHGNEHKVELEHIAVLNVRRPPSNPLVRVISSCLKHLGEGQRGGWCRLVQMLEQNSVTPSLLADNEGRDYHFSKHCRYQIEIPKTVLCSDRGHITIQKWSHIFIQTSLRQIRTVHAHYIYVITFTFSLCKIT